MNKKLTQGKILSLFLLAFGALIVIACFAYALIAPLTSIGDLWFSYLIGFILIIMGLPKSILK
jgi:hypothetical protein